MNMLHTSKDTKKVRTSKESLNSFTNTACNYIAEDLQEAGLETDGQSQISDSWQKGQKKMNLGTSLKVHTVAAREHPTWDRLFMELSGKIIPCWEFVVLDLYGTGGNSKIDEAKENYPRDVKRQIYFCLNKWKESLKDPPNIEMVISVLARHRQLSQNDINKLKKKYSSL
ncbi:hypothetical protein KUTeg_001400 [Tegillarca granosa]|uniref:Death domain-containing protein n=1 Tax=Tegillarca granosa TaxID=220873 RepID=A0ABQ9FVU8_TEGGR|nr:hypothetical protein KUTeg_001400 [Tegillarca granosa]